MLDRDRLGDIAPHRQTDEVSAVQLQRVEQAHSVGCHVRQGVGRRGHIACRRRRQVGHRRVGKMRGQADVTIVEPDHLQAVRNELGAEALRPVDHLRGDALHQQHGRRLGVTDALVCHLNTRRTDIQSLLFAHRHTISLLKG